MTLAADLLVPYVDPKPAVLPRYASDYVPAWVGLLEREGALRLNARTDNRLPDGTRE